MTVLHYMKLKTVTLIAAIAQLPVLLIQVVSDIRSMIMLAHGNMKWEDSWLYFISMPFSLVWGIALSFFFFTLVSKQKDT